MAERYRFFGGTQDDPRQYNQTEFAEVMNRLFTTGIFAGVDQELAVTPTDPPRMAVRVGTGEAWIRGYWYKNDSPKEINLAPADPTYDRIDRIVLRLDTVDARNILAIAKTGTPAADPVAPALEQNAQYWEVPIARVRVSAGATSISAADITDERNDKALAPGTSDVQAELDAHIGSGGNAHALATTTTAGFMSAADKSKLNGIAAGAEVNQNAFSNVKVGATTISADSKTDTLELVAGSNITLTPDASGDRVTISAAASSQTKRVIWSDTTTTIAASGTVTKTIALGVPGKRARLFVMGEFSRNYAIIWVGTSPFDARALTAETGSSDSMTRFYSASDSSYLTEEEFGANADTVRVKGAYLSGNNLIIEFQNVATASATLAVRELVIDVEY